MCSRCTRTTTTPHPHHRHHHHSPPFTRHPHRHHPTHMSARPRNGHRQLTHGHNRTPPTRTRARAGAANTHAPPRIRWTWSRWVLARTGCARACWKKPMATSVAAAKTNTRAHNTHAQTLCQRQHADDEHIYTRLRAPRTRVRADAGTNNAHATATYERVMTTRAPVRVGGARVLSVYPMRSIYNTS